jgi:hypothetical protein
MPYHCKNRSDTEKKPRKTPDCKRAFLPFLNYSHTGTEIKTEKPAIHETISSYFLLDLNQIHIIRNPPI